jgi:hypothetical protein
MTKELVAIKANGAARRMRAKVMESAMVRCVTVTSYTHGCVGGILRATCQRGNKILQNKSSKSVEAIGGYTTP